MVCSSLWTTAPILARPVTPGQRDSRHARRLPADGGGAELQIIDETRMLVLVRRAAAAFQTLAVPLRPEAATHHLQSQRAQTAAVALRVVLDVRLTQPRVQPRRQTLAGRRIGQVAVLHEQPVVRLLVV